LYLAADDNNDKAVESFLSKGLDPEENEDYLTINAAWDNYLRFKDDEEKEKSAKIMMILLNGNSRFPTDKDWFETENVPKDLTDFVDKSENLHRLVDKNDFDAFKDNIRNDKNLIYYYNKHNESVFVHGLRVKKYQIISYIKHGLGIGNHEDLDEVFDANDISKQSEIFEENFKNAKDIFNDHIYKLILKSKTYGNLKNNGRLVSQKIANAFETINTVEYCSKILKFVANWKNLTIVFDFNNGHVKYINPKYNTDTWALAYPDGKVLIGAKDLWREDKKCIGFGTIIHELCHAAMHLIYYNNFNPYAVGHNADQTDYEKIVAHCKGVMDSNWYVNNAFYYPPKHIHSELIVTYPQALMACTSEEIDIYHQNFRQLVDYSKNIIGSHLDRGLVVLKMLQDESEIINYDDLTEPLKMKVLNSDVEWQGQTSKLNDLVPMDSEIAYNLTSNNIKDILINKIKVKIEIRNDSNGYPGNSELPALSLDVPNFENRSQIVLAAAMENQCIVKRVAPQQHANSSQFDRTLEMFNQLKAEMTKSKAVVICSLLETRVSTFLKTAERKLKKENKNYYVSYINLKDYALDIPQVMKIFKRNELSADVQAIYLLDGLDNVWTKYGEFWIDFFTILNKESKVKLWISATHRLTRELEKIFNIQAIRFASFTDDEIKDFIENNLLENPKKYNDAKIAEMSEKVLKFLKYLDSPGAYESVMNNLTLIKDIISLYTKDDIVPDQSNLYKIFSKIDLKMCRKYTDKRYDLIRSNMIIETVHNILALVSIFGENYEHENGLNISELAVFKDFKATDTWTFDVIQDYGYVTSYPAEMDISEDKLVPKGDHNLKNGSGPEDIPCKDVKPNLNVQNCTKITRVTANFIHKSFAEYFVAKYVIGLLINTNHGLSEEEHAKNFKIIEILAENAQKFLRIREFIFTSKEIVKINGKLQKLIAEKISKIHREITFGKLDSFEFFAKICKNDQELENKLWKINENQKELTWIEKVLFYAGKGFDFKELLINNQVSQKHLGGYWNEINVFEKILYPQGELNVDFAIHLAEYCFGKDWHKKLNQSGKKLDIIDENLPESWKNDEKIQKLCSFVDKNIGNDYDNYQENDFDNACDQEMDLTLLQPPYNIFACFFHSLQFFGALSTLFYSLVVSPALYCSLLMILLLFTTYYYSFLF